MPVLSTPTAPPRDMDDAWTHSTLASRYDTPKFGGETFEPEHDEKRLTALSDRVKALMLDCQWRTLSEISTACRGGEASCSARLRDLRKRGWTVERRSRGERKAGLFEYRLARSAEAPMT
jgi:hypothetical protein